MSRCSRRARSAGSTRDATRLAADEEQRVRAADWWPATPNLDFADFVILSASDPAELARICADHEQVAAQAGLELRALDGRHDLGVVPPG